MSPEIRRAALRAAQKVALSMALGACSVSHQMIDEEMPTDLGSALADAGSRPMEILDAMSARDARVVVPDAGANDAADMNAMGTCSERLLAYVSAADPGTWSPPRESDRDCCTEFLPQYIEQRDLWNVDDPAWQAANYCCGLFSFPQQEEIDALAFCSPWGPPMPPAMIVEST